MIAEFFCGIDPAPSESHKSDDGAIMVAAATPRFQPQPRAARNEEDVPLSDNPADWFFDFVFAQRITSKERASARQWAGIIHTLHRAFRFAKIGMDPQQGGLFIQRELINVRQLINGVEQEVTPIADQVDGPHQVARADFILHLIKRGDPAIERLWPGLAGDDQLNDAFYSEMKDAVDHGLVAWPPLIHEWNDRLEEFRSWPIERQWALRNLSASVKQYENIVVATREDGGQIFTKRGARMFSAVGKKDFVSAGCAAHTMFRAWLRSADWRAALAPEDEVGYLAS